MSDSHSTPNVPTHIVTGNPVFIHSNPTPQLLKCTDTIENHKDNVRICKFLEIRNMRHLVMFDGVLNKEFLLRYVRNIKQALTWRNTLCNDIDTMNTMLLRAGKQRIHVQGIAQQGKINYDTFGKPKNDNDPDAMLVLFCEKLCGQAPLQLGTITDLNENLEFQRAWRKAAQTECMNLFEKQREQMLCTIETGLRERVELKSEVDTLKAAVAAASDLAVTNKDLKAELDALKEEKAKLKTEEALDVG
eukprot:2510420-Rhodomonas_salina.1